MRLATRRAAGLNPGGWTGELRDQVEGYFDDLAHEWHTRSSPERTAVVMDALVRGLDAIGPPAGVAVEVGSGIGTYSHLLAERFTTVVVVDLSMAMLKLAPIGPALRIQGDGARLPLGDSSAAAIVLINAFVFPAEVDRVLAPEGVLLWVNSSGEQTPIYLSVDDLVAGLPGAWTGMSSRAGEGHWCVLRRAVTKDDRSRLDRPHHERIEDPVFRRAVDLIDDGDVDALRDHLTSHRGLVRQRVVFEGGNYFRDPTLLEFVAENPIRHDRLPPNIVEVARLLLDSGARVDQRAIDSTLGLVCSGRVPREHRVQIPLIDLLCEYGADPHGAMVSALGHGEFEAVEALIRLGARVDLAAAAATGRVDDARRELPVADAKGRHYALAWAAQYGHTEIVRLLLDAGEDPNRYNPEGSHAHSTPLHQAALARHAGVVRLLLERGARLDIKDIHHQATALGWAEYAGHAELTTFLRRRAAGTP